MSIFDKMNEEITEAIVNTGFNNPFNKTVTGKEVNNLTKIKNFLDTSFKKQVEANYTKFEDECYDIIWTIVSKYPVLKQEFGKSNSDFMKNFYLVSNSTYNSYTQQHRMMSTYKADEVSKRISEIITKLKGLKPTAETATIHPEFKNGVDTKDGVNIKSDELARMFALISEVNESIIVDEDKIKRKIFVNFIQSNKASNIYNAFYENGDAVMNPPSSGPVRPTVNVEKIKEIKKLIDDAVKAKMNPTATPESGIDFDKLTNELKNKPEELEKLQNIINGIRGINPVARLPDDEQLPGVNNDKV